jgi:iron complex outermembrane recepter protein
VLGGPTTAILLATTPTNPFTTTISVTTPNAGLRYYTTRSESRSGTIGAVAQLPWGWTGALDITRSENRFEYSRPVSDAALGTDFGNGLFNPFVDPSLHPLDLSGYAGPNVYRSSNRLTDIALRGSGPLPVLPWGQPNLTIGIEHRESVTPERIHTEEFPITTNNSRTIRYFANESVTDSLYLETIVPLVKQDWLPAVHSLDLQASGRSERYQVDTGTFSEQTFHRRTPVPAPLYGGVNLNGQPYFTDASYTSHSYTVGLKYQPRMGVILRASLATAFLPPTPGQLVQNPLPSAFTSNVLDPVTGLQTAVFTQGGGNPDLKPQNSKSFNFGLIWEPQWEALQGVRLNAEYYRIEQFDAIGSLTPQSIVNLESIYPERVTRDASNRITLVDTSLVNLYRRDTEGWDLNATYTRKTAIGTFGLSATQSIILHLKNQFSQSLPEYDAVGFHPADLGGVTKYKSNVTLDYEWRGWTAGWTARYVSSYKQFGVAGGPNSRQSSNGAVFNTSYIAAQGGDTIPSQTYHDFFVGYSFNARPTSVAEGKLKAFGRKVTDRLSVQFGVRNVFDKIPPLDAFYENNFYVSPYGDMRLRSYRLSVRKAF